MDQLVGESGGEEPLQEELYVAGVQLLAKQLAGRCWEAEPPRTASLQETVIRLRRLGRGTRRRDH